MASAAAGVKQNDSKIYEGIWKKMILKNLKFTVILTPTLSEGIRFVAINEWQLGSKSKSDF